jgi:hypothetical protein
VPNAIGTYGFANIGTGTFFGSVNISGTGPVSIPLDAAALAAITADQGSTFSLGGVDSESPVGSFDFGFSGGIQQLQLDGVSVAVAPVPEPATIALLATGLAALAVLRHRRSLPRRLPTEHRARC